MCFKCLCTRLIRYIRYGNLSSNTCWSYIRKHNILVVAYFLINKINTCLQQNFFIGVEFSISCIFRVKIFVCFVTKQKSWTNVGILASKCKHHRSGDGYKTLSVFNRFWNINLIWTAIHYTHLFCVPHR